MLSALRSILFLLFQIIVTPFYAFAMVAMAWSPTPVDLQHGAQLVRGEPVGREVDLRHSLARRRPSRTSPPTRGQRRTS